jgi:nucleoside-diphosphate-sugar epimerase
LFFSPHSSSFSSLNSARTFFELLFPMPARPPVALVTGATGYVASEITAQLLRKGWTVRGSVRDLGDARCQGLAALADALPGSLTLHAADLLSEGAFDALAAGADYVFHIASPFFIASTDPHADLITPAVAGTINVLAAVARAKAKVKRVILTSSVAAVHGDYAAPPVSGDLYTEADYNGTSTIDNGQAYHSSKVQAEEEAWRVAHAKGIDLVTILPNFVLGPPLLAGAGGTSIGYMVEMIEGRAAPSGAPVVCDVRDVARAHVLAAESPGASGRYIVSHAGPLPPATVGEVLAERLPGCVVRAAEGHPPDLRPRIDGSRVTADLGLALRPMRETVADMVTALCALGLAAPREVEK